VFTQDFNEPIVAKLGDLRLLTGAAAVTTTQTFIWCGRSLAAGWVRRRWRIIRWPVRTSARPAAPIC